MGYQQVMQFVDTARALTALKLEIKQQGGYVYFPCPSCKGRAVAKAYGEKKNLTFCTSCKESGNLVGLTQKLKGVEYDDAVLFLKGISAPHENPRELKITYDLQYHEFLKTHGITEETCATLDIGVPKGKTMLAGCVAFKIVDKGIPIAYFGVRMKDYKPVFHRSFNPELVLYHPEGEGDVYFSTSMFDAVKKWQEKFNVICNFGLPYLSPTHLKLINEIGDVTFHVPAEMKKDFALIALSGLEVFYRFI